MPRRAQTPYATGMESLRQRLAQRFGPLRWAQRSGDAENWDAEYRRGRWDYLRSLDELAHHSVIAGYCKFLRAGGAILDLGCGEGVLIDIMDPQAYSEYLGVDIAPAAIERALARYNGKRRFVVADISAYQPPKRFDIVIFNESLYYLSDPLAVMRHYENYLAADGMFIVSMYLYEKAPLWRRLGAVYDVIDSTAVANKKGMVWHCKVLQPRIA